MNILTDCVRCDREYGQLLKSILSAKDSARNPLPVLVTGLCDGATDATYVALAEENYRTGNYDRSQFPDSFGYRSPEEAWAVLQALTWAFRWEDLSAFPSVFR